MPIGPWLLLLLQACCLPCIPLSSSSLRPPLLMSCHCFFQSRHLQNWKRVTRTSLTVAPTSLKWQILLNIKLEIASYMDILPYMAPAPPTLFLTTSETSCAQCSWIALGPALGLTGTELIFFTADRMLLSFECETVTVLATHRSGLGIAQQCLHSIRAFSISNSAPAMSRLHTHKKLRGDTTRTTDQRDSLHHVASCSAKKKKWNLLLFPFCSPLCWTGKGMSVHLCGAQIPAGVKLGFPSLPSSLKMLPSI